MMPLCCMVPSAAWCLTAVYSGQFCNCSSARAACFVCFPPLETPFSTPDLKAVLLNFKAHGPDPETPEALTSSMLQI